MYEGIKNPILIRTFTSKWWPDHVKITLSSLTDSKTWRQIWIDKSYFSTLRNLVFIVIPNYFEKHVKRTSQIKVVIYKKIYCLKRINSSQNKKMLLQISINISDRLQTWQIFLVDRKIIQCHQGMTRLTIKIKNEFSINHVYLQRP